MGLDCPYDQTKSSRGFGRQQGGGTFNGFTSGFGSVQGIVSSGMPGASPIIAIDTGMDAMQRDGIDFIGGGRGIRRRHMGSNQMSTMPPAAPSMGSSMGSLTVHKLE